MVVGFRIAFRRGWCGEIFDRNISKPPKIKFGPWAVERQRWNA